MKSNEEKLAFSAKTLTKEILYNSLAQILLKIVDTPYLTLKLFLTLFLVATSSLAAYLLSEALLDFLNYEVTTTSRTIFEMPALFPKITICNQNPFTSEDAVNFLREVNKASQPSIDVFNADHLRNLSLRSKSALIENIYLLAITKMNSPNFTDESKKKLGHTLEDILLYCKFNRKLCSKDDFAWKFDKTLGNCYVFNTGRNATGHQVEIKDLSVPGMDYGLKMELYVNYHEQLRIFNALTGEYGNGIGAKIRIENSSYSTDTLDGIDVSSGVKTSISIQRMFKRNLPRPYSNCEISNNSPTAYNSELYYLIANSSYIYEQQLCFGQCRQKVYIDNCNCTTARIYSLFTDVKDCETPDEISCKNRMLTEKILANNFMNMHCLPLCPLECHKAEFKTTISSNPLNGDLFADIIMGKKGLAADFNSVTSHVLDVETAVRSVAKLNLFYESLSYTLTVESPKMSWILLLAYMGGIMGLFLGVSVLSICELVELLIELYFLNTKYTK